jgi:hypothetical protein
MHEPIKLGIPHSSALMTHGLLVRGIARPGICTIPVRKKSGVRADGNSVPKLGLDYEDLGRWRHPRASVESASDAAVGVSPRCPAGTRFRIRFGGAELQHCLGIDWCIRSFSFRFRRSLAYLMEPGRERTECRIGLICGVFGVTRFDQGASLGPRDGCICIDELKIVTGWKRKAAVSIDGSTIPR